MKQKSVKLDKIQSIALRIILAKSLEAGLLDAKEGVVEFLDTKAFAEQICDQIDTTYQLNQKKTEQVS